MPNTETRQIEPIDTDTVIQLTNQLYSVQMQARAGSFKTLLLQKQAFRPSDPPDKRIIWAIPGM